MADDKKLNVVVFMGSVRPQRLCDRITTLITNLLEDTNHNVIVLDPKKLPFPLLETSFLTHPEMETEAPAFMRKSKIDIEAADAYIVVAPEFYQSIPPALSNMIIHFAIKSYVGKPLGIICYSNVFGGCRVAMQLRTFGAAMGATTIPHIMYITNVTDQISPDGKPQNSHITFSAMKLVKHLDWYATAFRNHREEHGSPVV